MSCRRSYYRGAKLTQAQMQMYLRQAGWPEDLIPIMSAIGVAESSGWTCALDDGRECSPAEYSLGVWQINQLAHNFSSDELCDPQRNAEIALQVYQDQGLRAWGPYTSGLYRQYLSEAQAVYAGTTGVAVPPAPSGNGGNSAGNGGGPSLGDYALPLTLAAALLGFYLISD